MTFLLEVKKMLELFRNRMNKIFLRKGVVLHYKLSIKGFSFRQCFGYLSLLKLAYLKSYI